MDDEPRQVLAQLGFDLDELSTHEVTHNQYLTPGIWELSSPRGHFILKRLAPKRDVPDNEWGAHWLAGSDEPRRWNYWAREGLAYTSELVAVYGSSGIVAPRLMATSHNDEEIVLLLEFVEGEPAERWNSASYVAAATALGHAQGHLLVEQAAAPDFPWLSQGFLRQYSSEKPVDWTLLTDDSAWSQPLVRRNFPPELREAVTWLHGSRERLYAIAEALPRTLCHLDFWTKNLIRRDDGIVVLFDWAFVGDGALGEDIGNLVPDAAFDHFVPAESLPDLAAAVLDGYLDGPLLLGGMAIHGSSSSACARERSSTTGSHPGCSPPPRRNSNCDTAAPSRSTPTSGFGSGGWHCSTTHTRRDARSLWRKNLVFEPPDAQRMVPESLWATIWSQSRPSSNKTSSVCCPCSGAAGRL